MRKNEKKRLLVRMTGFKNFKKKCDHHIDDPDFSKRSQLQIDANELAVLPTGFI